MKFQADKEKKKKTKKKEEPAPPPAEEKPPTPTSIPKESGSTRASSRGSRKAKRAGSSVFSMFTQKQVAEFKEVYPSDILIIQDNRYNLIVMNNF
ncbi:hypothetical protein K0M31_001603 [Melipona bicolor]|uniref:Uncharacterized protein n=1 Tax=Melipona bicolor TaxID=60889 RepID=A0AA40KXY1_9HYME|nr:hypothetical protein K0M31_001603 [Melipona bicolor]